MVGLSRVMRVIRFAKRRFNPKQLSPIDIILPHDIEILTRDMIKQLAIEKLALYKALDVIEKTDEELEYKGWSSWDMAILLRCLKEDIEFGNYNKSIFPKYVKTVKKREVEDKIYDLVMEFIKEAPRSRVKYFLQKDFLWSHKRASCLLYFLCEYSKNIDISSGKIF